MDSLIQFTYKSDLLRENNSHWEDFLKKNYNLNLPLAGPSLKVNFESDCPVIIDELNHKFQIDFINDKINYNKKKLSIKNEPLSKALGKGDKGLTLLDLSAGLGIDSFFLFQLGYSVTALERNPVIYMALACAEAQLVKSDQKNIKFIFGDALDYLKNLKSSSGLQFDSGNRSQISQPQFDVGYFDPMFPSKKSRALPRQEMVFFKKMVGEDLDADQIVEYVLRNIIFKRFVVKRPLSAKSYFKPAGCIKGKIIRYDIYGS